LLQKPDKFSLCQPNIGDNFIIEDLTKDNNTNQTNPNIGDFGRSSDSFKNIDKKSIETNEEQKGKRTSFYLKNPPSIFINKETTPSFLSLYYLFE